jgi:hypothetical protein
MQRITPPLLAVPTAASDAARVDATARICTF